MYSSVVRAQRIHCMCIEIYTRMVHTITYEDRIIYVRHARRVGCQDLSGSALPGGKQQIDLGQMFGNSWAILDVSACAIVATVMELDISNRWLRAPGCLCADREGLQGTEPSRWLSGLPHGEGVRFNAGIFLHPESCPAAATLKLKSSAS
jgi:hypothetical protein